MNSFDILAMGAKNLWRRKMRTFLTVLGVMIGTASIVVMISLGIGINETLKQQLEQMGDLTVIEVWRNWGDEEIKLDDEAMEKIEALPGVEIATPILDSYAKFVSGKYSATVSLVGMKPEAMPYLGMEIAEGRFLTDEDDMHLVFGSQVPRRFVKESNTRRRNFYYDDKGSEEAPDVDVMEDQIRLTFDMSYGSRRIGDSGDSNKKPPKVYRVDTVGLLAEGDYSRYAYQVIMPLATLTELVEQNNREDPYNKNRHQENEYQQAVIKATDVDSVDAITHSIESMGYQAHSLSQILDQVNEQTKVIRAILGGIGAVALLVAAIGIMNTMVMSIYERTKEIGVMKVVGAALGDIGKLFLVEAALIGLIGGCFGLGVSYGLSHFMNTSGMTLFGDGFGEGGKMSIIPLWLALSALGFTSLVGLISGFYPARRAMKLSALEAIRSE